MQLFISNNKVTSQQHPINSAVSRFIFLHWCVAFSHNFRTHLRKERESAQIAALAAREENTRSK